MASEEDELDRVMVQSWQAVAQSLRQTSTRIDSDLRMLRRERTSERMARARQLDFDRRQLAAWKSSNHATLNRGFDSVLRATVLNPSVQQDAARLSPADLARAWMVADQMDDVRFIKDKADAKTFIERQWSQRGIEQPVSEFADRLANHVSITATGPSEGLDATMEAFQRAGAVIEPVSFVNPSEAEGFIREHHGQSFSVSTTLTGSWDGIDNDRLAQAVLTSPVSDPHARVDQLRRGVPAIQEPAGADAADAREPGREEPVAAASPSNGPQGSPDDRDPSTAGQVLASDHADAVSADGAMGNEPSPSTLSGPAHVRAGGDVFGEMSPAQEVAAARRAAQTQGLAEPVEAPTQSRSRRGAHVSV